MKVKTIQFFGKELTVTPCQHAKLGNGVEFSYGDMYSTPDLTFTNLMEISNYFGTVDVSFEHYSEDGCETCGYGGAHGYNIQVFRITKNNPFA
jgi:hypothetical protein